MSSFGVNLGSIYQCSWGQGLNGGVVAVVDLGRFVSVFRAPNIGVRQRDIPLVPSSTGISGLRWERGINGVGY